MAISLTCKNSFVLNRSSEALVTRARALQPSFSVLPESSLVQKPLLINGVRVLSRLWRQTPKSANLVRPSDVIAFQPGHVPVSRVLALQREFEKRFSVQLGAKIASEIDHHKWQNVVLSVNGTRTERGVAVISCTDLCVLLKARELRFAKHLIGRFTRILEDCQAAGLEQKIFLNTTMLYDLDETLAIFIGVRPVAVLLLEFLKEKFPHVQFGICSGRGVEGIQKDLTDPTASYSLAELAPYIDPKMIRSISDANFGDRLRIEGTFHGTHCTIENLLGWGARQQTAFREQWAKTLWDFEIKRIRPAEEDIVYKLELMAMKREFNRTQDQQGADWQANKAAWQLVKDSYEAKARATAQRAAAELDVTRIMKIYLSDPSISGELTEEVWRRELSLQKYFDRRSASNMNISHFRNAGMPDELLAILQQYSVAVTETMDANHDAFENTVLAVAIAGARVFGTTHVRARELLQEMKGNRDTIAISQREGMTHSFPGYNHHDPANLLWDAVYGKGIAFLLKRLAVAKFMVDDGLGEVTIAIDNYFLTETFDQLLQGKILDDVGQPIDGYALLGLKNYREKIHLISCGNRGEYNLQHIENELVAAA